MHLGSLESTREARVTKLLCEATIVRSESSDWSRKITHALYRPEGDLRTKENKARFKTRLFLKGRPGNNGTFLSSGQSNAISVSNRYFGQNRVRLTRGAGKQQRIKDSARVSQFYSQKIGIFKF